MIIIGYFPIKKYDFYILFGQNIMISTISLHTKYFLAKGPAIRCAYNETRKDIGK